MKRCVLFYFPILFSFIVRFAVIIFSLHLPFHLFSLSLVLLFYLNSLGARRYAFGGSRKSSWYFGSQGRHWRQFSMAFLDGLNLLIHKSFDFRN